MVPLGRSMAYSSAPSEPFDRRVIRVLAPLGCPLGTTWVPRGYRQSPRRPTARAGTLDQQKATVERVSKEVGALADLVEENEAKGRMGQVRVRRSRRLG